jgi:hypothetical protein
MVSIPEAKQTAKQARTALESQPTRISPALATSGGFTGDVLRQGRQASPILEQFETEEQKEVGTMEVLKSAFALENTVGAGIANIKAGNFGDEEEDPDFDVLERIEGTDYEPYLDSFKGVFNENQFANITSRIDNERAHRDIIASNGITGMVASIVAGIFDLVNLIPIGGSAYKAFKAGKVVKGLAQGAKVGGLSAIASESILQSQQELRTIEESAFNVAGSAVLGGLIGGLSAKLSRKQFNNLAKRTEDDIQRTESQVQIDNDGNLSAAKVERTTLDQETLAGGKITQAVIKSTKKLNPMLRVLEGNSVEARRVIPQLVRTNMYFKKNADDIATDQSVEIAIKQYDRGLGIGIQGNRDLAKKANKRLRKEGSKLSLQQFNDEVSLAMIRGDKSNIPEVQQAAQTWRREVFDPLKQQAIEQKILSPDVKPETAVSYMMRQYNTRKIIAQEPEFRKIIETGARERLIPELEAQLKRTEKKLTAKQLEKFEAERKGIDSKIKKAKGDELDKLKDRRIALDVLVRDEAAIDIYVQQITDSVVNNIRGIERKGVAMPYDLKIGVRGPAKERVLTFVTDEEIRPFLETNIDTLAKNYTRVMGTDVELKRSFGDLNLKDQLEAIGEDYTDLRSKAKTEKERIALDKEEKEVREIINAFKDLIRGDYGRPNNPDSFWPRASRISRMVQYMSKLGGVAISSIPDMSRHVMVHGFNRVFGKGLKNVITNTKGIKLSVKDAKEAGNILEAVTHQRSALMADLGDPYKTGTQFETMLSWMSDNFSKVNGLDYWNNAQKAFSSVLTQQRLIENINKFDSIKPAERKYMAFLGIDSNNVDMLKGQIKRHSFKEKDMNIANLEKWDDDAAASIYKNALNTDVDRTIVTKGVGDIPLLMNTELGKTIFQFKSFAFAAHQQVTIAAMQQADAAAISGITTMISMGMMTYYLKQKTAGRDISDDPQVWLAEGIDRSGIIPVIAEINGVADVFGFGAGTLTGQQPLSRFATRNKVGGLIGPSFGGVVDAATFSRALASGEIKESDLRALRKNLPYQNIFYLRGILNDLERGLAR